MPRPSRADERRKELLPLIAEAFGELGYRRATTAELAQRCGVQENVLYRLWRDKKAMFVAAIEFLYYRRMGTWQAALEDVGDNEGRIDHLVELTAKNLGEDGLYRIIFAALSETDDKDVKQVLQRLYRRYYERVLSEVRKYRKQQTVEEVVSADDTAWSLIALVAFMNIAIDLDLMSSRKRQQLFARMAYSLLAARQT